jgi:DNA polymerase elongation subunit (family B)
MSEIHQQPIVTSAAALFGHDPTPGIVAVEPDPEQGIWLYRRDASGVHRERMPYRPWILLTEIPQIPLPQAEYTELEGDGFRILAEYTTPSAYQEARFRVRDEHLANLTYPGGAKMALIRSGMTLFKGMTFDDVVRFQFDLETNGLNPAEEAARILLIAVSDNRGLIDILEGDEREILERFAVLVRERDPDVIEGHNIFGFDLPFLMERARRHAVALTLGRDGSEPRRGQERNYAIAAGGNTRPFVPIYIHGRHVVDTYLVVQRFDWAKQALSSYGLKECARVFGFAEEDRVELPRAEMARYYRDEPELVRTYARQDVIETLKLADLITPVEFYQAQMVPDGYGQVIVTGNGEKINAIFVRSYLAAGRAIPRSRSSEPYEGGYTEVRARGVLTGVVKADVESLYPSLMLTHQLAPQADTLGVFLPALRELTQRRLDAKRRAADTREGRSATLPKSVTVAAEASTGGVPSQEADYHYWDGLQGSYKVLINSFYGYLGGPFNFNDYSAARRVTELGRILVQDVAARLEASGSRVIEIDTDGVFFVPPAGVQGMEAEREYIREIGAVLPDGIRLAFDGRFAAMLSLKTKNYVLVGYDGRRTFKGASLRSRADERYGRLFLTKAVDCLLEHDYQGVADLYARTIEDLLQRRVPIEDLVRRERITEKTFQSEQKRRAATVAAGIAIGEHVMVYEKMDGSLGLLADYAGDENPRYYMDKLYKFARRLEDAFADAAAFSAYIPKPTAQGLPHKLQTSLDLFG